MPSGNRCLDDTGSARRILVLVAARLPARSHEQEENRQQVLTDVAEKNVCRHEGGNLESRYEGNGDPVEKMEEKEEAQSRGKELSPASPSYGSDREHEGGEGNHVEGFIVDDSIMRDDEPIAEQGKTEDHDPIDKPNVPALHFEPEEEHAAGDQEEAGQKGPDPAERSYGMVGPCPAHPHEAREHEKAHGEYLPQIDVSDLEKPRIVATDHEDCQEPCQITQIQRGNAHGKTRDLVGEWGGKERNEAGEEADHGKSRALEDDPERESGTRDDVTHREDRDAENA